MSALDIVLMISLIVCCCICGFAYAICEMAKGERYADKSATDWGNSSGSESDEDVLFP